MNPSSLDWSIQSSLSSLFPPFEATAPTVLSQLFRTIDERYHGDALQCFLDYLIPSKHILESVQQAACADYSDVLFRCEGWPLCLGDRVVIQLAPINPLLLRPGDFYLQVEPFGEQSARIVLKSLLVHEGLLAQDDLKLKAGFRGQEGPAVEETPIPETSYSCIFTEAWLKEVNEGRHAYRLHQCVLSSDQGIVKVPWTEVINPEFLDKTKVQSETITSCLTALVIQQDNQPSEHKLSEPFSVNPPSVETDNMILMAKDKAAASVQLLDNGSKGGKPVNGPVGKPVGWVSPNSWDSRRNRELEGEYVDLLDFAKKKDVLGHKVAVIPSVPVSFRPAPPLPKRDRPSCVQPSEVNCVQCQKCKYFTENEEIGSESKGRHRQSYLAAIKNPVCFDKTSVMVPLDEAWPGLGEAEPGNEVQAVASLSSSPNQSTIQSGLMPSDNDVIPKDQNLIPMINAARNLDENTRPYGSQQPNYLLTKQRPEDLHQMVLEYRALPYNRQRSLTEAGGHEPCQIQTSVQKHAKIQHLPKMGRRALADPSNNRLDRNASKCQGGPNSSDKITQLPLGNKLYLCREPENNQNVPRNEHSHVDHITYCENKQCAGKVLKALVKNKSKARSTSSVSDTARECLQEEKPTSRSRSDVCPEIIPMVPEVQLHLSKKCSNFGLGSPKRTRRKDILKASSGTVEAPAFANGQCATESQALSFEHGGRLSHLSQDPVIKSILQLGIIYLPGSRDRTGRGVLEIHGAKKGWTSPQLSPLELCKVVLYLFSIPRKVVRELGFTVVIDSRHCPLPSVLYEALVMVQEQGPYDIHSILLVVEKDQCSRAAKTLGLQVDILTSLKSLHKAVDVQHLTTELGGSFHYDHTDWLQFYQKHSHFELQLQGAAMLLQRAIKKLDSNQKTNTTKDVRSCIQEHKSSMKEVLEDTQMVTLQREGGAILARMRKEEFRFAQSADYRDLVESTLMLYNQVEEGVHTLVTRSNQSLQHLEHLLLLKETEEQLSTTREWCDAEAKTWQRDPAGATKEKLEHQLAHLNVVHSQAQERKDKAMSMLKDVETRIQGTCYPETNIFHSNMMRFKTNMVAFLLEVEQHKSNLEALIQLYCFCEQALALTNECSDYLEQMEASALPVKPSRSNMKFFQERFKAFSLEHFEEEKNNTLMEHYPILICVWSKALSQCQDVKQRLEKKLLEYDTAYSQWREDLIQTQSQENSTRCDGQNHFTCDYDSELTTRPEENLLASGVCQNIRQNSEGIRAEILLQTQLKEIQPSSKAITSFSEQNSSCAFQNSMEEPTHSHSKEDNNATLPIGQLLKLPCEHHCDAVLMDADLMSTAHAAMAETLPCTRRFGRSNSEGSCARSCSSVSSGSTESAGQKQYTVTPKVMQSDPECAAYHQDSFCSNTQLEWVQTDLQDKCTVSLDDQESQISQQNSFSFGKSHPSQDWLKEVEGSEIDLAEEVLAPPSDNPKMQDRLKEPPGWSSTVDPENCSNALKLQHIMEELLQTEREYVNALGYVIEHYFPELERPDVPQDLRGQRGSIFGNLEKLREFHQHFFLKELELCLKEPFCMGHCFLRHKESFSLYALYSKNKPRSDHLLINHGKEFFKQKQQQLHDKMDLSSYLLKPVQRISKYSLLLRDMLQECKSTAHKGQEQAEIQAALGVIQFQLRHGNNLLAMDDIRECDVNLKEQGQLIHQDEFLVSFRKKKCYRHVFLFQDLILFSKTKKTEVGNDTYIYKQSFKTSDIGMTYNSGESGLCFEIWFRRRKTQDTYTLQARSQEVKEAWTKDLERILWEQAIHNREIRMQERVYMGIGYKPYMDIKPSDAAISNRAINCTPTVRDCKATAVSGIMSSQKAFPHQRPDSTGSASYISSFSQTSSSSSSGRSSLLPVVYLIGPCRSGACASDHGRMYNTAVLEEFEFDQDNSRRNLLGESSESSNESVSGFSSSGYSCQSVIGGDPEEHCSELTVTAMRKPGSQQINTKHEEEQEDQKRDQPLSNMEENNPTGMSTEV